MSTNWLLCVKWTRFLPRLVASYVEGPSDFTRHSGLNQNLELGLKN
ncbi:hypothetical protein M758_12G043800 [Ceratodon purpureus]|uniref:Uncharacterized protein n=1 Tax=Ceratodon purpureus TaxID=3225 RepID=A0A8T0G6Z1_CERPU|nr:hypothetical protein KC19_12G041900 [Ceratodon purpureus]KAG0598076.1 hypothetical protein M758_12G043800 [Ceratodon purpureus]